MTSAGREPIHHNEVHDADLDLRIPARYRHDWALFADWCAAADHRPIPAAPETLALFLHEHPAAAATQRRRLSAINAGSSPVRWCARSSRDSSSSGYAVNAGVTSSVGSVTV